MEGRKGCGEAGDYTVSMHDELRAGAASLLIFAPAKAARLRAIAEAVEAAEDTLRLVAMRTDVPADVRARCQRAADAMRGP